MKQYIVIAAFFGLMITTLESKSQNNEQALQQIAPSLSMLQAGTATLANGKAVIKIEDRLVEKLKWDKTLSYIVMLTPYNTCGPVIISEKSNSGFVIAQTCNNATGAAAQCDYIVILKETPEASSEK